MIDFLKAYYREIISLVLLVFQTVLLLIAKKNPKVIDNSLIVRLCNWIREAEGIYVNGSDKFDYVINKAREELGESFVYSEISNLIEWILSLPEKKGVNNERSKKIK